LTTPLPPKNLSDGASPDRVTGPMAVSPRPRWRVLVVEDDPLSRELICEYLEAGPYEVVTACDGVEAWHRLEREVGFDVVVLDRMMPRLGGLELLARMKEHPRLHHLPVIVETAAADQADIAEGIRAGAHYYLTKPLDGLVLESMVRAAATDHDRVRQLLADVRLSADAIRLLETGHFSFRTPEQATGLGALLAKVCPDPERVVVGLTELLVNAVEHGNLEIDYELKGELLRDGRWAEEVRRRLEQPRFRERVATVRVERVAHRLTFVVRDQGPGFDARPFMVIDPQRCFDNHGRGIAIANLMSFDSLEYHDDGREAVASLSSAPEQR
jgi:CheY-like chemotaxis protein